MQSRYASHFVLQSELFSTSRPGTDRLKEEYPSKSCEKPKNRRKITACVLLILCSALLILNCPVRADAAVREEDLPRSLPGAERKFLLQNGFFVDPVTAAASSDAAVGDGTAKPRFITADSALHAFAVCADRAVWAAEEYALVPLVFELITSMENALMSSGAAEDGRVRDFLAAAKYLLTNGASVIPDSVRAFADNTIRGSGRGHNPFLGREQDFRVFAPTGHYTQNIDLKSYFRAMRLLETAWPKDSPPARVMSGLLNMPTVRERHRALCEPLALLTGAVASERDDGVFSLVPSRIVPQFRGLDFAASLGFSAAVREAEKKQQSANRPKAEYLTPPAVQGDSLYGSVVNALRDYALSSRSSQVFARAAAWNYKKLATAEGVLAEIGSDRLFSTPHTALRRHNVTAPAAPSTAKGAQKRVGRGYVEPVPELYSALARALLTAEDMFRILCQYEDDNYSAYPNDTPVNAPDTMSGSVISVWRSRLYEAAELMQTLAGIAEREIADAVTQEDYDIIAGLSFPLVGEDALPRRISVFVSDNSGGMRVTEGYMFYAVPTDGGSPLPEWNDKMYY